MRNSYGRMGALVRAGACLAIMLGLASPAAAQFGGLKKKLKSAAGQEAAAEGAKQAGVSDGPAANAVAPGAGAARGGSVVLTPEVVDQMIAGLQAAKAYGENARTGDTPYGRYSRAKQAYDAAQAKCQANHQANINRMASDEKLANQYSELMDKMTDAMGKGDREGAERYQYQALGLLDPNCAVREPKQPDDFYQMGRDIDTQAESEGVKKSGLSQAEYAMARERGEMILRNAPPPDASESEKKAVQAKSKELKQLLGIEDPQARAMKPEPAPTPQPAPTSPTAPNSGMSQGQMDMNNCVAGNAQQHEKEIEALGERAKAAQEAGDMNRTMAIADTIRRLQMAGCDKGK